MHMVVCVVMVVCVIVIVMVMMGVSVMMVVVAATEVDVVGLARDAAEEQPQPHASDEKAPGQFKDLLNAPELLGRNPLRVLDPQPQRHQQNDPCVCQRGDQ